ncbi:hypothetical protein ABKN59_011456 [Abortiporus biennis]
MATLSHHAERGQQSLSINALLLEAAIKADEHTFSNALKSGADVNVCDDRGRTVIGCALGGERWEEVDASDASFKLSRRLRILKLLLEHEDISLHALNAPQNAMRGVTPLGLAAWLNIPNAVRLFLEHCPGLVSVDGMDTLGGTALMYAARDGSSQVIQHLLANGARPDYRDINHRTAVQHALRHPQALWLCESALRRHRAQECLTEVCKRNLVHVERQIEELLALMPMAQPHPRLVHKTPQQEITAFTASLVSAVVSADVSKLHSILLSCISSTPSTTPTVLINNPDSHGWSPIHYCVSVREPSRNTLDLLYRMGADVSLYTTSGHGTPLHCLAYKAHTSTPPSIRAFIHHLVFDLRAPLSARDQNKDTCIHIAAERGESVEVLAALLSCDTSGTVREIRNSRGLTAFDICKPQFRAAFGVNVDQSRCGSSASVRTVKPSTASNRSSSSLASLVAETSRRRRIAHALDPPEPDVSIAVLPHRILDGFRFISAELSGAPADVLDVSNVEAQLRQVSDMSEDLVMHHQARIHEAVEELGAAQGKYKLLDTLIDEVMRIVETTFGERLVEIERAWDSVDCVRRRTTDSGDSGSTAVSEASEVFSLGSISSRSSVISSSKSPSPVSTDDTDSIFTPSIVIDAAFADIDGFVNIQTSLHTPSDYQENSSQGSEERGLLKLVKELPKKKSKSILKARSMGDLRSSARSMSNAHEQDSKASSPTSTNSASKLKAWFRRKMSPDSSHLDTISDVEESGSPSSMLRVKDLPRSVSSHSSEEHPLRFRRPSASPDPSVALRRNALTAAKRIIAISSKDLCRIQECIFNADRYISHANRSVAQAQNIMTRCLAQRETVIGRVRLIQQLNDMQHALDFSSLSGSPPSSTFSSEESLEFPPVTIPSSPRDSQLIFPRPPPSPPTKSLHSKSSMISLTSTLIDGEDEDARALRRLLTRKIDARIDAALVEIEKVTDWLRVVRDVVVALKKRTSQQQDHQQHYY